MCRLRSKTEVDSLDNISDLQAREVAAGRDGAARLAPARLAPRALRGRARAGVREGAVGRGAGAVDGVGRRGEARLAAGCARHAAREGACTVQRERASVCVCVCARERERERERARESEKERLSLLRIRVRTGSATEQTHLVQLWFIDIGKAEEAMEQQPTLEVTQGQILRQSATDATRFWWHLYGSWLKKPSMWPWVASRVDSEGVSAGRSPRRGAAARAADRLSPPRHLHHASGSVWWERT